MLKLDNNLLQDLGLGALPEDQKKAMLQHIYETLELRVGTNLANQMTDQQLEEFEKFIDEGGDANQAQALQWLESNLPNYKQVVNQVFEQLKGEIAQTAPQIMASSNATPNAPIQQQPQQPVPAQMADSNQYSQQYQAPQQPAYTPQPIGQPQQAPQGLQQPYTMPTMPQQFAQPAYGQPQTNQQPSQQQPSFDQRQAPQFGGGFQPAPQGYQPAPQGFQAPQQQPYPPSADTDGQQPLQDHSQ